MDEEPDPKLDARRRMLKNAGASGTVAEATAAAGYRSRTSYYTWNARFEAGGEPGLLDRKSGRPRKPLAPHLGAAIRATAFRNPEWGARRVRTRVLNRLRIPPESLPIHLVRQELDNLRGAAAPSRDTERPPVVLAGDAVDVDQLTDLLLTGIGLDRQERSRQAVDTLWNGVWAPIEDRPDAWMKLMREPGLGPLLLVSRLNTGHALMNAGEWRLARYVHNRTREALDILEQRGLKVATLEDRGLDQQTWDDLWFTCHQELATVTRDSDPERAIGLTRTAIQAATRTHRQRRAWDQEFAVGNLNRQLASMLLRSLDDRVLRSRRDLAEIETALRVAEAKLAASHGGGHMLSDTAMLMARLRSIQVRAGDDRVDEMIALATGAVRSLPDSQTALRTNLALDLAALQERHGMFADLDWTAIRSAAEASAENGYARSARRILSLAGAPEHLPEDLTVRLYILVRASTRPDPGVE